MVFKTVEPNDQSRAFMAELKDALKSVVDKHPEIDGQMMLAVASQLVGNLIALQDQRLVTAGIVMEMVARNIEMGNAEAVAGVMASKGSA